MGLLLISVGFNKRLGTHGGVHIKLKLGKDETGPSKDDSPGSAEKIPDIKEQPKAAQPSDKKPEPERKIIKFDTPDQSPDKKKEELSPQEQKKKMPEEKTKIDTIPNVAKIVGDKPPGASTDAAREELEQRRTILQNMKDFDFQIKKNQEDLTTLNEKVENLSKDLDDLVSLYEIVSEQMNPFVGLSKVTKKRIDALENFTKEVDSVKNRIGDLESLIEKSGISSEGGIRPNIMIKPVNGDKTKNPPGQPPSSTNPQISIRPVNERKTVLLQPMIAPNLSDAEIDELLTKSLESIILDQNIDTMIDEFFLTLK
jgi:flagellar protein FlaC